MTDNNDPGTDAAPSASPSPRETMSQRAARLRGTKGQAPETVLAKDEGPSKYKTITDAPSREEVIGGQRYRIESSECWYDHRDVGRTVRSAPDDKKADAAMRRAMQASEEGGHAAHRHGGGVNPRHKPNLYIGHANQNAYGAKRMIEHERDRRLKADPDLRIHERSTLTYQVDRPGFGNKKPISEKVTHRSFKDGKEIGKAREVTLGQFPSSASRYADHARGQPGGVNKSVVQDMQKTDRHNLRHTKSASKDARALRQTPGWPSVAAARPRLVVDNTQTPGRQSAGTRLRAGQPAGVAPSKTATPRPSSRLSAPPKPKPPASPSATPKRPDDRGWRR